jgi:hypothetical protein
MFFVIISQMNDSKMDSLRKIYKAVAVYLFIYLFMYLLRYVFIYLELI